MGVKHFDLKAFQLPGRQSILPQLPPHRFSLWYTVHAGPCQSCLVPHKAVWIWRVAPLRNWGQLSVALVFISQCSCFFTFGPAGLSLFSARFHFIPLFSSSFLSLLLLLLSLPSPSFTYNVIAPSLSFPYDVIAHHTVARIALLLARQNSITIIFFSYISSSLPPLLLSLTPPFSYLWSRCSSPDRSPIQRSPGFSSPAGRVELHTQTPVMNRGRESERYSCTHT